MGAVQLGELFLFPVDERPSKSSFTTTPSWVEVDFSADVPAEATGLMLACDFKASDGRYIVSLSEDNTSKTPAQCYRGGLLEQQATYAGANRAISHVTIAAPGGKFYIAEYDSAAWDTVDGTGCITLLGYYMAEPDTTALTSGSDFDTSAFTYGKFGEKLVFNGEIITNAAVSSGDTIGTLPAGSRPDVPCIIDLMAKEGSVIKKVPVSVDTNGLMVLMANVGQTIHLTAWNILRKLG